MTVVIYTLYNFFRKKRKVYNIGKVGIQTQDLLDGITPKICDPNVMFDIIFEFGENSIL